MDRPRGAKEFQRLIQRHAAEIGQSPQRVMHLIRVGVVCAFLDGVRHTDGAHVFVVKGGTAMQLRLGIRARATTDLDVMFRGLVEEWLARFDEATVDQSWEGFTVTRKGPPVQIAVEGVGYKPWRVPLQVRFDGREFGPISLEVAIDNDNNAAADLVRADGIELASFGIGAPQMIPCLDVAAQIAQKLHACTELLPAATFALAAAIGRGAEADQRTDAAVERLTERVCIARLGADRGFVVAVPNHDATAALVIETLSTAMHGGPRRAAATRTVRVAARNTRICNVDVTAGATVELGLATAGYEYGFGADECPGRELGQCSRRGPSTP